MGKQRFFIALFGLPFLAVGIWALWEVTSTLVVWGNMSSWVEVQAHVTRGGYESHSNDGTTYRAYGEYTYTFNGESHRSTHVSMYDKSSDNVGHFQEDLGNRLQAAQGQDITAYVDPDAPEKSIIDRDIRWGMIGFMMMFVVAFGGAGGFLVIGSFYAKKPPDPADPRYEGAPWLANDQWQSPEITADTKAAMYGGWFFAVIWNAVSAPMPFLAYDAIMHKGERAALIGLIFNVIGIGLIIRAINITQEWKKFGTAPVTLDPFPGSIGGNVGGTVTLPGLPYDAGTPFTVTLMNVQVYSRNNSTTVFSTRQNWQSNSRMRSDDDIRETILWQSEAVAYAEQGELDGTRLVFRFDVPEGLNPSDAIKHGNNYYCWRLNIRAQVKGTDVDLNYDIPVYASKQQSRSIASRAVEGSKQATLELAETMARRRITTLPGFSGEEVFYPMGRNLSAGIGGMVIGLCFAGPGVFLWQKAGEHFFGFIFVAVGLLIFFSCFYLCVNSLTVRKDAGGGGIETIRRIFGITVKRGYAAIDDIEKLSYETHFSQNSGNRQSRQFTLHANLRGGKSLVVGEGFASEAEAQAAITVLSEKLGIKK